MYFVIFVCGMWRTNSGQEWEMWYYSFVLEISEVLLCFTFSEGKNSEDNFYSLFTDEFWLLKYDKIRKILSHLKLNSSKVNF